MTKNISKGGERNSSIELLKIFVMFGIVVSHVTLALLPSSGGGISDLSYCIDYRNASADPAMWLLVILRTPGDWGNSIFVICAAWFLACSGRVRLGKVVKLALDVVAVSLLFLFIALALGLRPGLGEIVKSVFPNTFLSTWFVTCYLMLYAIHPGLNLIFEKVGKRGHALIALVLFVLYMLIPVIHGGHYYWSRFFVMIAEYTIVAYARYYLTETLANRKVCWAAFLIGTLGTFLLILLLEQVGLRVSALSSDMLHFYKDGDPLLFLSAFGLFNLVRSRTFVSRRVNSASSLMLLVFLVHCNLLVRIYGRPAAWSWIHDTLGYDLLFVWLILYALVYFAASLLIAFVYSKTIDKGVAAIAKRLEGFLRGAGGSLLDRICALR